MAQRHAQHGRTGDAIAALQAAWEVFLVFAIEVGALAQERAECIHQRVEAALAELAAAQGEHQRDSDPIERYWTLLAAAISSGRAHVASTTGGAPISRQEAWGWRQNGDAHHPLGARIGWIAGEVLYLEPAAAYAAAEAVATGHGVGIAPDTLHRRLHERAHLLAADRGRHTVKVVLEGERHRVLKVASCRIFPQGECGASGAESENG
jgi:hypothetical protein